MLLQLQNRRQLAFQRGHTELMKKYPKEDQKALAKWAADCAQRVLPIFENACPGDDRPRKAIEACRTWVRTGENKMAAIRGASLSAHAAARDAQENPPACFAARAAGQAVATAHVPQHAFGAAYYALRAIAAADPAHAEAIVAEELARQIGRAPKSLRAETQKRIVVHKKGTKIAVKVVKDKDF
jgi:hypothetical protein